MSVLVRPLGSIFQGVDVMHKPPVKVLFSPTMEFDFTELYQPIYDAILNCLRRHDSTLPPSLQDEVITVPPNRLN